MLVRCNPHVTYNVYAYTCEGTSWSLAGMEIVLNTKSVGLVITTKVFDNHKKVLMLIDNKVVWSWAERFHKVSP
jgi:hypothetical protein